MTMTPTERERCLYADGRDLELAAALAREEDLLHEEREENAILQNRLAAADSRSDDLQDALDTLRDAKTT